MTRKVRTAARSLFAKLAPERAVRMWDEEGSYPVELYEQIAALGWYDIVPEGIGTEGALDGAAGLLVALCEEIGRSSSDLVALFNLLGDGLRELLDVKSETAR